MILVIVGILCWLSDVFIETYLWMEILFLCYCFLTLASIMLELNLDVRICYILCMYNPSVYLQIQIYISLLHCPLGSS